MLTIRNLSLYLSKDLRPLLNDFTFTLLPGMKAALIGEEGNGKSALLKAIADPKSTADFLEIEGEIQTGGEIIGYLPQVFPCGVLAQSTKQFLDRQKEGLFFDYTHFYTLLAKMQFPKERISSTIKMGQLSGGEKIKFYLLCEMLKRPGVLLLDEPSNDLDLEAVEWLENFILRLEIPLMFVSHDEMLLEKCADTIIHLEQLVRKSRPQHAIANLPYSTYIQNRQDRIIKQTQLAKKEKEEYDAKMARYRQIYERVHHEQNVVSRQAPSVAKNLKDKMRSVKAMGRRFAREKEEMTARPDFEAGIELSFAENISIPNGKLILDLDLPALKAGNLVLSRDLKLRVFGPKKICIVGANGSGKTTFLRQILQHLAENGIPYGYMPQDYNEILAPGINAVDFLSKSRKKEEITRARTYLGSLNFTAAEMFHPVFELSGGQQAKLCFAKMILDQAEVLVLDEPTRNLSPLSGPAIREALKEFGGCIIAVSHDRKFIKEVFDQVMLLDESGLEIISFPLEDEKLET
ncbi:MAG TPA: ABC-F family ATP-binding cassette domain-containing protein [Firmicutes bacterium]|nr:ABC-F family ATP-binding cassette domain-containing protein [Bacillota bacterium]